MFYHSNADYCNPRMGCTLVLLTSLLSLAGLLSYIPRSTLSQKAIPYRLILLRSGYASYSWTVDDNVWPRLAWIIWSFLDKRHAHLSGEGPHILFKDTISIKQSNKVKQINRLWPSESRNKCVMKLQDYCGIKTKYYGRKITPAATQIKNSKKKYTRTDADCWRYSVNNCKVVEMIDLIIYEDKSTGMLTAWDIKTKLFGCTINGWSFDA